MPIRKAQPGDGAAIAAIYNHYIANTVITFEEEPVSDEEMIARVEKINARHFWLVMETEDGLLGYAYAGPWHARSAYRYSVESTVYLHPAHTGRGLGTELMEAVLRDARVAGFHSAIAGVALPNEASVRLHEKLGYKKAAHYHEVGFKFGKWIDVGYWQLML